MRIPKEIPKRVFIAVANGTWNAPDELISKGDISKLWTLLDNITVNNGVIPTDSPEYLYFQAIHEHGCSGNALLLWRASEHLREVASSLFLYLSKKNNASKIKQCLLCKYFFIAKDVKRIICYKKACVNEYHKQDMKYRRKRAKKTTPVKTE
jgi:hypothetical protein